MNLKTYVFVLAAILSAGPACSKKDGDQKSQGEPIVAMVNAEPITRSEFIEKAEKIQEQMSVNLDVFKERRTLLDSIISSRLIYQKALKEGMADRQEFKDLLANYYLEKIFPGQPVSDEEARKYFESQRNRYESVRVSHILIKPLKENDKYYEDLAVKNAGDLLVRILNGEDFAELAMQYSHDQSSAKRGGDLGHIKRGSMVKEFEDAAFSLKEQGDTSKVVRTKLGFHIIKLSEKRVGFGPFADEIRQRLFLEKNRAAFAAFVERLRKEADIFIDEETLRETRIFREPFSPK